MTARVTPPRRVAPIHRPVALCPPGTRITKPPLPCRCSPDRSTIASSKPISSVHTGLKRFSTTALVASVVDTDTSVIFARLVPCGKQIEHRSQRLADADRKIPRCRERFGAGDDLAAIGKQHRVGNVPPVSSPSQRSGAAVTEVACAAEMIELIDFLRFPGERVAAAEQ